MIRTMCFLFVAISLILMGCSNQSHQKNYSGWASINAPRGDYMPDHLYLVKAHPNSSFWYPSLMKSRPVAAGGPGYFIDVRTNRELYSNTYVQTRPAVVADIKLGGSVFCNKGAYYTPNTAAVRWRDTINHWELTTVVDVSELNGGYIQAGIHGILSLVHISNIRIPK